MKTVLILALVSLGSANAFALPMTSPIARMDLDPKVTENSSFYNAGSITVDTRKREAGIYLTFKCPPGRMCTAMMVRPFVVSLELIARKTDRCGTVVYTAESDRRMVDGLRQTLTIFDHTNNKCPTLRLQAAVEATYETSGYTRKGNLNTVSTFEGQPFITPMN